MKFVVHVGAINGSGGVQTYLKSLLGNNRGSEYVHLIYSRKSGSGYPKRKQISLFKLVMLIFFSRPVIHLHNLGNSYLALFFVIFKYVYHEHGVAWNHSTRNWLYRIVLTSARVVISNSNATASLIRSRVGNRPPIVTLNPPLCALGTSARPPRALINDHAVIRVGFIGRLEQIKGTDALLELAGLIENDSQIQLSICGVGSQSSHFENSKLNNMQYNGFADDLRSFLHSIDIGIIPSIREPFGLTPSEYMIAGVPVIIANVDGMGEFYSQFAFRSLIPNTPVTGSFKKYAPVRQVNESSSCDTSGLGRVDGQQLLKSIHEFRTSTPYERYAGLELFQAELNNYTYESHLEDLYNVYKDFLFG